MNTLLASKLRLPKKGMIRAAPMATLPAVMRELGADFEPIMAAHGLSNQVFEDPEASVSYETMCGVLAACSRASGCPHIGLLVGQRGGIASLGVLGYLMLNAPDVRSALDTLIQHMDVHDRGAAPTLELRSHVVMLRYDILLPRRRGGLGIPVSDAAMAIGRNIMLSLCGPTWKPLEVHLRHAAPDDVSALSAVFSRHQWCSMPSVRRSSLAAQWLSSTGARRRQRSCGATFRITWMPWSIQARARLRRPGLYPAIQRLLVGEPLHPGRTGPMRFSMQPRGRLNRRLQQAGTSFRALQNQARHALARELLRDTTSDMATIANLLGYTSASAFVRAFAARCEGLPPAAWRRTAAARSAASQAAGASAANRSA
jgi:hypothetical protein